MKAFGQNMFAGDRRLLITRIIPQNKKVVKIIVFSPYFQQYVYFLLLMFIEKMKETLFHKNRKQRSCRGFRRLDSTIRKA